LTKKTVHIDMTREQLGSLRREVFSNQALSVVQRRTAVKKVVLLPRDGSPVDLYCDGDFIGSV